MYINKILVIAPRHYIDELKQYYQNDMAQISYLVEENLYKKDLIEESKKLIEAGFDGFIGLVDWSSLYAAYLNKQINKPSPNLTVLASLQDKLLSRELQMRHVNYDGLAMRLKKEMNLEESSFPLFLKPRRAAMSFMAKQISSLGELALIESDLKIKNSLKIKNRHWKQLYQFLNLSQKIENGIDTFVIESILPDGIQVTLDGFSQDDNIQFFGFTKSVFLPNRVSFKRFDYPYRMPKKIMDKVYSHAEDFVKKSKFSNSLFNIEYKIDLETSEFAIVEINTRPSSQFMYAIGQVSGVHPLDVAIDIVTGVKTSTIQTDTAHESASICVFRQPEDALVKKLPSKNDMKWFFEKYPEGRYNFFALEGEKLSQYPNDSHSFRYAEVVILHPSSMRVNEFEDDLRSEFVSRITMESVAS